MPLFGTRSGTWYIDIHSGKILTWYQQCRPILSLIPNSHTKVGKKTNSQSCLFFFSSFLIYLGVFETENHYVVQVLEFTV